MADPMFRARRLGPGLALLGAGAALLEGAPASFGQAFNIDMAISSQLGTPPAASYGAAGAQAGFWNVVVPSSTKPLVSAAGGSSSVVCQSFLTSSGGSSPGPGGVGERELFDDYLHGNAASGNGAAAFFNLQPGPYDVYVYSWWSTFDATTVVVNVGASGTGGGSSLIDHPVAWPGGLVEGLNYARFRVGVGASDRSIRLFLHGRTTGTSGVLSGVQIVPVPSAPTGAVGLAGLCLWARRERRADNAGRTVDSSRRAL